MHIGLKLKDKGNDNLKIEQKSYFFTGFIVAALVSFFLFSTIEIDAKEENVNNQNRLEAYNKLRKVISAVETYYVDELSINDIVDKAIEGLMANLDEIGRASCRERVYVLV